MRRQNVLAAGCATTHPSDKSPRNQADGHPAGTIFSRKALLKGGCPRPIPPALMIPKRRPIKHWMEHAGW